jgi:hypothetical protein
MSRGSPCPLACSQSLEESGSRGNVCLEQPALLATPCPALCTDWTSGRATLAIPCPAHCLPLLLWASQQAGEDSWVAVVSFWTLVGQHSIAWVRLRPPQNQKFDRDPSAKPHARSTALLIQKIGWLHVCSKMRLVGRARARARARARPRPPARQRRARTSLSLFSTAQQCRTHSLQSDARVFQRVATVCKPREMFVSAYV